MAASAQDWPKDWTKARSGRIGGEGGIGRFGQIQSWTWVLAKNLISYGQLENN